MRIALVSQAIPSSGVGRYAFEIYRMLTSNRNIDHLFLNYGKRELQVIEGLTEKSIAKFRRMPDYKYFFYYRCQSKIPSYDLYHITNQNLSFLKLTPKIVTCHDLIQYLFAPTPFHRLHAELSHSGLKNAEFVITVSHSTKKDLIKFYSMPEERIKVIYEGIDHGHFYKREKTSSLYQMFGLSPQYKYILHLSMEVATKNVAGIIQAFAKLAKEYGLNDVKLIKAGVPKYQQDRKRNLNLIKKLRLEESVIFLDYIPEKDLPSLYGATDLFVFPSFYEGFGFPVLEAMACGTPVITSNTSSLPEVVGDAGVMVDPYDVDALAKAMYDVLTNKALSEEMIHKGVERAKIFTWEKCAEETLKVYEEINRKYKRGEIC